MAVCFAYSSKKCKCGWTRLPRKCSGDTVAPAWKFTEPKNKHYMKYCGRLFQATYYTYPLYLSNSPKYNH